MNWLGIVTEDGRRFLADQDAAFREALAEYAGDAVVIRLSRPITPAQRGYWQGVLVPLFADAIGEPVRYEAHRTLLELLDLVPGALELPSTASTRSDADEMSDRILRASAVLTQAGIAVPAPERDVILRAKLKGLL